MKCSQALRFALMLVATASVVGIGACSTLSLREDVSSISADRPVLAACQAWFTRLDEAAASRGLRDREAAPVAGYPHLRVSRLLASYRNRIPLPSQQSAWLARLRAADQQARQAELANLGLTTVKQTLGIEENIDLLAILTRTNECGDQLVSHDQGETARLTQIRARAHVPDDYSTWQRVAGLHLLARPFLAHRERKQQQAISARLAATKGATAAPASVVWPATVRHGQTLTTRLVSSRRFDALGLPVITDQVREWLLREFAPVIATRNPLNAAQSQPAARVVISHNDVSSAIAGSGHPNIALDANSATVYGRLALTRYAGRGLIQLVYTIWSAEPGHDLKPSIDTNRTQTIEPLTPIRRLTPIGSGFVYRVTLDSSGIPVMFDMMQANGGEHIVLPSASLAAMTPERSIRAGPTTLPTLPDQHRVRIWIDASANHLAGIDFVPQTRGNAQFDLLPEELLRALPVAGDNAMRHSIYTTTGLVHGAWHRATHTPWPAGIRNAGQARQWGHHPVSLTERRHFDDPDLLENSLQPR